MRAILLVLVMALLSGCLGGNPDVTRRFYSLQAPNRPQNGVDRRFPARLLVRSFDVTLAYKKQEIVYRLNPWEFSYYNYRLWAARPDKMLRDVITAHLRRIRLVSEVSERVREDLPDLELEGEVLALEELDSSESEWYGHLAMRVVLLNYADRKPLWEYSFDEKVLVAERTPIHVVRAVNEILVIQLEKIVEGLDRALVRAGYEPGGAPVAPKVTGPEIKPEVTPEPPVTRPGARRIK